VPVPLKVKGLGLRATTRRMSGVTSVAVNCFDRDLDGKIATLSTVAAAARRAGVDA